MIMKALWEKFYDKFGGWLHLGAILLIFFGGALAGPSY